MNENKQAGEQKSTKKMLINAGLFLGICFTFSGLIMQVVEVLGENRFSASPELLFWGGVMFLVAGYTARRML